MLTFEGPEGAGKSTQIARLAARLQGEGRSVVVTREPGGTPLAEKLRNIVKYHKDGEVLYDETELLLLAASRAQHVRCRIMPALKNREIVLCDRFTDSTLAYQGYGRGLNLEQLRHLNNFATGGLVAALTILLDLPVETGLARSAGRDAAKQAADRLESAGLAFHHRVRTGFLTLAKEEPQRIRTFDATLDADTLELQIWNVVNELIQKIC